MHIYIYLSLSLSLSPSRLYCLFIVGGHQQSAVQRPPVQVHQGGIKKVPFNYQSFHLARLAAHDAAPGVPSFAIHSVCVHVGMAVI